MKDICSICGSTIETTLYKPLSGTQGWYWAMSCAIPGCPFRGPVGITREEAERLWTEKKARVTEARL